MAWSRWRDDSGSLPLALLIAVIGVGFSTMLASTTVAQIENTRRGDAQTVSLSAAQTGIDVAMAHIRDAFNGTDQEGERIGVLADLPCTVAGEVSANDPAHYQVKVVYLTADPVGQTDSWLDNPANPSRVGCTNGVVTGTPTYAALRSTGRDVAGSGAETPQRTVRATYTFRTTTENIPGGQIHAFRASTSYQDLCLDGGLNTVDGTQLRVERCVPGSARQIFEYNSRLNLVLKSSKSGSRPLGLCLDAGPAPNNGVEYVRFKPCVDPPTRRQQWSFNDYANFEAANSTGELTGQCFNVQTPGSPSYVVVGKSNLCKSTVGYNNREAFLVDSSAGAGMAGAATSQVVNFQQFGRCIDVTSKDPATAYLIVWPCKQQPNADFTWNQKWTMPKPRPGLSLSGNVVTRSDEQATLGDWCLTSPSPYSGYAKVIKCSSNGNKTWTRYGEHKDELRSYTLRDNYGKCLSPSLPPDLFSQGYQTSKLTVATCNGSALQKWNAPAGVGEAQPLKDIGEGLGR